MIRGIKGNFRREFVMRGILDGGLESVPPAWLAHDLSMVLKNFLTSQHPRAGGGEDLPDLEAIFRNADPSPMDTDCEFEFQSFIHTKLASLGAKKQEGGSFVDG